MASSYADVAIQRELDAFQAAARPGFIDDPLFETACRLYEFANAGEISAADVEARLIAIATQAGHALADTRSTLKSARKRVGSTAATIPQPTSQNGAYSAARRAGYTDLAAYAAARGVPAEVFERAGWSDSELYEFSYTDPKTGKPEVGHTDEERLVYERRRRALQLETDAGPRWRLIDEDRPKPKYWQRPGTHRDHTKAWYRLGEALALAVQAGVLVLVNGEPSVVVGQHHGIPALCETGGGEKLTPPQLLQLLTVVWPREKPVLIVLDCDGKGQKAAIAKRQQYRDAGYQDVRAVDLALGPGEDVADACRLHQAGTLAYLLRCADLPEPQPASQGQPGASPAPTSGQAIKQSERIMQQLRDWGYTFQLNKAGNLLEINGELMDDVHWRTIRNDFRDIGWGKLGAVEDAYHAEAARHAYHPIQDYLKSIAWDGQLHIAALAKKFTCTDPLLTYADGQQRSTLYAYLYRWLIGAVAKVFAGEQNSMLVLAGPQDIGKSAFAAWLCSGVPKYFIEEPLSPGERDNDLRLITRWIWEVGELDGSTRRADRSALKAFITKRIVTVRKAYGHFDTSAPAMASLIGTINPDHAGFLDDPTGNRRFWVTSVTAIDWSYRQLDVNQVWAEAVAAYRSGTLWQLSAEEKAHRDEINEQYSIEYPLESYLLKHLHIGAHASNRMSAADIIDHLRSQNVMVLPDRRTVMEIGSVMTKLKVQKIRDANMRYYIGVMPRLGPKP